MSKKCLSLILVLSMIMQLICIVPAMATETGTLVVKDYFVNDTFDSNVDNWTFGTTTSEGSIDWDDDGYMVLTRTSDATEDMADGAALKKMIRAERDFEDLQLSKNKITIETRLKVKGNADNKSYACLRFNLPTDERCLGGDPFNYLGNSGSILAKFNTVDSTVSYKNQGWSTASFYSGLDAEEWVNVKAVLDPKVGTSYDYELTVWEDNDEANAATITGTLLENSRAMYDSEAYLETGYKDGTQHGYLRSLAFTLSSYASEITVDYVKAYTEKEISTYSATAYLTDGILLDTTDAVKVTFVSDSAISSIPEGAVAINGVTAIESYDAATKTLTLTPDTNLTPGAAYTVTFDEAALESIGMLYNGNALNFKVKGYGVNYFINDDFNTDGNIGAWKLVYGTESGKNITLKQTTLDDGTGVMELGADRYSSETTTSLPTISNDFKDISFSQADEIVIETRFMATGGVNAGGTEGNTTYLKFNQPEDKSLAGITPPNNGGGYLGSQGGTLIQATATAVSYKKTNGYTLGSANDNLVGGEWINAKIVLRPNEGVYGMYTITTWEDGKEDEAVTKTDGVLQENAIAFYDPQAYKDNGNSNEGLTATKHTALKNLLFAIRQFSNTMYIDYIKGYTTLAPDKEITGVKMENSLISQDAFPEVVLETEDELDAMAISGAFAIDGMNAFASYDAITKTVTLYPDVALEMGGEYTVTVDADALYNAGVVYSGAETVTFNVMGYGKNYFVDDDFNTENDLEGWSYGIKTPSTTQGFIEQTTEDGAGVMHLSRTDTNSSGDYRAEVRADREFADIALDGNKIVIETRMKSTGNTVTAEDGTTTTSGRALLRFNSPSATTYAWVLDTYDPAFHWTGWNGGVLADLDSSNFDNKGNPITPSIKYKSGSGTVSDALTGIGANNTWANVKMVIDGTDGTLNDYTFSVWADGNEANATTLKGTLNELSIGKDMYDPDYEKETGATKEAYDTFKNLAFSLIGKNDLYVDYVKAYLDIAYDAEISASLEHDLIDKADAVVVNIATDDTLTSIPEGAIYIDGVKAAESFDATAKTLTLTPEAELDSKATYTVKVDTDVLNANGIDYTGEATFTFDTIGLGVNYFVNDDFNTGLGKWSLGTSSSDRSGTINWDENGYMVLTRTTDNSDNFTANEIRAERDFGDVALEGNKIVIETRMKSTGNTDGNGLAYLRFNAPTNPKYTGYSSNYNWVGWDGGVLAKLNASASTVGYKSNEYSSTTMFENVAGDWVNTQIIIDGTDGNLQDYTITVWKDNDEANAATITKGTLKENNTSMYDIENYVDNGSTTATMHTFLKNLSYTLRNYAGTVTVDFIRAAIMDSYDVTATMDGGSTVKYNEPIKLTFKATDAEITSIPDGAVTISGVETSQSFDAETGVLSVTPAKPLTAGNSYTVTVNKNVLESVAMKYTGTTSFTVRAIDEYESGIVLDDNFENGIDGWDIGQSQSGYEAKISPVDAEGAVDGKALKITFPESKSADGSYYGSVTKLIGNGIKFSTEETLTIKARVKTDIDMAYQIKANRPDTLAQPKNDYAWGHYNALLMHSATGFSTLNDSLGAELGGAIYGWNGQRTIASFVDKGMWTEYTITFKPAEERYYVTIVTTDAEGNETTVVTNAWGAMLSTKEELDKEFGLGYFDANDGKYYLDLSRLTFTSKTAGDLYVDYVKVFEAVDGKIINQSGNSAMYNEPLKFTLTSSKAVPAISKGAIKIEGVEASQSYDPATQVITLTPETDLTVGNTYKVAIDKDVLANDGITYTGTTSFSILARDKYEKTGSSYDFADENHGWDIGVSQSGYEAKTDVVDAEGARDGMALKIDFPARGTSAKNQYGSVTKKIDNGIEFNDDSNIIIETRVKMSDANGHFALKLNRPDTLDQFKNDVAWPAIYSLFENSGSSVIVTEGVYPDKSDEDTFWCPDTATLTETSGFDFANKWVTYKLTLNNAEKKIYTTITYTNEDGEEVTLVDNDAQGVMLAARWDIDAAYGKGAYDVRDRYYDALERLTFTSKNDCDIYVDYIDVKVVNTNFIGLAQLTVDGKEAAEITPATTVKPVFTINPEEGVTEYTVISALYIDGIMQDTHINPIEVTENGFVYTEEDGWVIPSALEGKYEIKAFVWDTLGGMRPVSEVEKIQSTAND